MQIVRKRRINKLFDEECAYLSYCLGFGELIYIVR